MTAMKQYESMLQEQQNLEEELAGELEARILDHLEGCSGIIPCKFVMEYDDDAEYPMEYYMEAHNISVEKQEIIYLNFDESPATTHSVGFDYLESKDLATICDILKI